VSNVKAITDIEFARIGESGLSLDLYIPSDVADPPTVLYFHGGGWQLGDKADGAQTRLVHLASHGIAVASANYRLAPATYPAPIHDAKAAVRWIRANGAEFGVSAERVAAWGASAGAYLATMLGLTAGDPDFEGDVGSELEQSSRIDAVVHWFGPSDLVANSRRSWIEKQLLIPPFEHALLGVDDIAEPADIARAASPLSYLTHTAPPFLISHGDKDRITPIGESASLHAALVGVGAQSTLLTVGGAGHEGPEFDRADHIAITAAFLRTHLLA
jgi:acetyl esterase/lipase